MLTVIAYHPTGYQVRIEVESEKLDATIRWLEKHNYRPVRNMNGRQARETARPAVMSPASTAVSSPDNGRAGKVGNGPGTAGVATINDELFGGK